MDSVHDIADGLDTVTVSTGIAPEPDDGEVGVTCPQCDFRRKGDPAELMMVCPDCDGIQPLQQRRW